MSTKKVIILVVILVILGGVGFGVYQYTKKPDDVVKRKPDFVVDVKTLLNGFESDSSASNRKYADKIIAVTGNVKRVDTSGAVVLGEDGSASEVVAGIDKRHIEDLSSLQAGKLATLQGTFSGYRKAEGDDLLSSLGSTVELKSAGIKK
ncbi:MAG: OB-fold protein [Candidatus Dadabacteria bacterium]